MTGSFVFVFDRDWSFNSKLFFVLFEYVRHVLGRMDEITDVPSTLFSQKLALFLCVKNGSRGDHEINISWYREQKSNGKRGACVTFPCLRRPPRFRISDFTMLNNDSGQWIVLLCAGVKLWAAWATVWSHFHWEQRNRFKANHSDNPCQSFPPEGLNWPKP